MLVLRVLIILVVAQIYEPVKDWEIKVRTTFDKQTFTDGRMKTVADLRSYFTKFKRRGEVFGYILQKNRPQSWAGDDLVKKVEVIFEYTDQHTMGANDFDHLTKFVQFLEDHPPLAEVVGYHPKK